MHNISSVRLEQHGQLEQWSCPLNSGGESLVLPILPNHSSNLTGDPHVFKKDARAYYGACRIGQRGMNEEFIQMYKLCKEMVAYRAFAAIRESRNSPSSHDNENKPTNVSAIYMNACIYESLNMYK